MTFIQIVLKLLASKRCRLWYFTVDTKIEKKAIVAKKSLDKVKANLHEYIQRSNSQTVLLNFIITVPVQVRRSI